MRFVSPILKRLVYPGIASTGYFSLSERPGLAVITYHGVLPGRYQSIDSGFDGSLITADTFRRQLRLLKRKYTVISPEDLLQWRRHGGQFPRRAALLTCDDGFLNNVTEMLPILQDEGLKCLFFITGGSLGARRTMLWYEELFLMLMRAPAGHFRISHGNVHVEGVLGPREQRRALWWDAVKRLSQVDAECREEFLAAGHAHFGLTRALEHYLATYPQAERHFCLLTVSEVRELSAAGMTIGAHTLSHPVLTQLPTELAWSEILDSKTGLESALNKRVWAFAYPFGDPPSVNSRILAMSKQVGFEAAFLNTGGGLGAKLPPHAIPRVHVTANMNLGEFEAHISGFYEMMQGWRRPRPETPAPALAPARP